MDTTATTEVHPLVVRITHWVNALAIFLMVGSGWRIYDASPLFSGFVFPRDYTIGGWLGGALQVHFAAMWLLVVNGVCYFSYGVFTGHFTRNFLPLSPRAVLRDLGRALRGHLSHVLGEYNAVQRLAYVSIMLVAIVVILSGLAIWKPVQLQALASLMGGYEGARIVHFVAMAAIVLFVVIHVVMVALVPRTFLPMLTGRARIARTKHTGG
jgi:thiosulfate reductase cytochrome b subunit